VQSDADGFKSFKHQFVVKDRSTRVFDDVISQRVDGTHLFETSREGTRLCVRNLPMLYDHDEGEGPVVGLKTRERTRLW
jgi:hypothetical protein